MDELRIRLFSDVSIQQQGQFLPHPSGKALELLCYLLIHHDRAHTREALAEVLWPGRKSAASRRYLRQALWRLGTGMQYEPDSWTRGGALFLISDSSWVRINPELSWWSDVSEFERAYAIARDTAGYSLSEDQANDLETALDLYRGDLLETWYQDWCSYERERLRLAYLTILDQLMNYCEARQLYAKGLGFGQVVLRYDLARERTHRQLMRLHYRAGDRIAAIRQYERCASAMAEALGVQPSTGTVALYEQIRADRVISSTPVPPARGQPVSEVPESAALAALHRRLDQIQASLLALHKSVLQDSDTRFEHARSTRNSGPDNRKEMLD